MRPLVLALALLAIAVAGCGGESKEKSYKEDFQSVNRSLLQLGRGVQRSFQTSRGESDAKIGREFGRHADRMSEIEGDLKDLDPPKKLAAQNSALLRAAGRVKRALRGIETGARKKDVASARRSLISLITSSVGLAKIRRRLARDVAKSG